MLPLATIIETLGTTVVKIVGPSERTVSRPAPLTEALDGDAITFCSKPAPLSLELVSATRAGVVIVANDFPIEQVERGERTIIVVADNPRLAFLRLVNEHFAAPPPRGRHATAVISPAARVHADSYVGPHCTVSDDCEVGAGSILYGNIHLYARTRIGRNVTIHAGTTIGADGFGYQRNASGELEKFAHLGGVVIEDNVEIGANTCIDRGTLGDTVVGYGTKVDNLVHIAHNVVIGKHCTVIAHAMIGGSTRIGDLSWVAPCACIREGLSIGERTTLGLGAVVVKDVPAGVTVAGSPARPIEQHRRIIEAQKKSAGLE